MQKGIERFLNENGQLIVWPKKHTDKKLALVYLSQKFEQDKTYSEAEINEILKQWHTFIDWPLLRRALVDAGMLTRDINGYAYRVSGSHSK